ATDELEQRALARTVLTEQSDGGARLDVQCHVVDSDEILAERLAVPAEMDDAILEVVVLAHTEVLAHVVEADDVRACFGLSIEGHAHSSCAKLPCMRVNMRWANQRKAAPMIDM